MKIYFLGTRSAYPSSKKAASSLALQHEDGQVWLFDCGEGTQIQLQKVSVSRQKINKIFITHLHGDHLFGLPGLLCSISMATSEETENSGKIVEIYGPQGLSKFLYHSLSLSHSILSFNYRVFEIEPIELQFHEDYNKSIDHSPNEICHESELSCKLIHPDTDTEGHFYWKIFNDKQYEVKCGWIAHGVPSYGFMIREHDKCGTINKDKLIEYGVKPGPLYGKLKNGISITSPDGKLITPEMVIGPSIKGRVVLILGDTSDSTTFLPCIRSCDVLIHEATHDDTIKEKAISFGHSTPSMAANTAINLGAKTLLLNHFSHRYVEAALDDESQNSISLLYEQASAALKDTGIEVILSDDLFVFEVKRAPRACN